MGTKQDSRNPLGASKKDKELRTPWDPLKVSPRLSRVSYKVSLGLPPQTGILAPSRSKKESNPEEIAKAAMVEAVRLVPGLGYWA